MIEMEPLRAMKTLVALAIAVLAARDAEAEKRTFRYLEKTGNDTVEITRTIEVSEEGISLTYDEGAAAESDIECAPDYGHNRWSYRRDAEESDYVMERRGDTLLAKGVLGGKPLAKEWKIDGDPWYQALEFALVPWLRSGGRSIRFWSARPTDLGVHRMVATREGEETVMLGGDSVQAIKVRFSPAGPLSAFWKAEYWYRKSDLRFIRYRAVRGLPGSPETIVTLIGE